MKKIAGSISKEIIIFGRSPFINKINFDKIDYNRFDICCINECLSKLKRIDYVVSADAFCTPYIRPETEWISSNNGWKIVKSERIIQQERTLPDGRVEQQLSWKHLSADLAVNFAIMRGYKVIYLAGIDLIEGLEKQYHYNRTPYNHRYMDETHRSEKEYIKKLCEDAGVKIYQLNPESDWLEYKNIC